MRLDIRYQTRFEYEQPVRESQNELRACPASDETQQLISYRVTTTPSARVLSFVDEWGTRADAFGVRRLHTDLEVVAEASVETRQRPLLTTSPWVDTLRDPRFVDEHIEYLGRSPHANWGAGIDTAAARVSEFCGGDVVGQVLALHRFVGTTLRYAPGTTYVGVEIEEVLNEQQGVCQDFAHLAVALCRACGIPARYVSGYLFAVDDATGAEGNDDVVNVQTHAWFEAAIPQFGWLALDPTNRQEVGLRHVKIGHGRDYDDVVPLRGVYAGSGCPSVEVSVEIRRPTTTAAAARPDRSTRAAAPVLTSDGFVIPPVDARRVREQQHQQQQQ